MEGTGWKVGLSSISVPDASIDLTRFKSFKFPLLSAQWMLKRKDKEGRVQSKSVTTDLTFQDILYDDNIVDGLSFMKALVFKFDQVKEYKRIVGDLTKSPDNGKEWEYTFKWEGEELVLDNSNLDVSEVKTEGVPYYMSFNEDLAFDMGWVKKNEKENVFLGPNLKPECHHATIPDPIDVDDFGEGKKNFWVVENGQLFLSCYCNWRFVKLNRAFQKVIGDASRTLFVYSDVGGSSVVGNQVTDLLREIHFQREGKGIKYFEPLHIQYIPLRNQIVDIIETQVSETTGLVGPKEATTKSTKGRVHRSRGQKASWLRLDTDLTEAQWKKEENTMTETISSAYPQSRREANPRLDLFAVPPTDVSVSSYRMVPVQTYTTGINPVEFQIDPQEDYIDLSRSFFEVELQLKKDNDENVAAADKLWPVNNLAHSLFKQISVRLNGTLISPQTDTYHYRAFLETLLNYDRRDGETILKPQGWYNHIDFSATWTDNNTNTAANAGAGHADYVALTANHKEALKNSKAEQANYTEGKRHVLRFKPLIEVFHLSKLLVPRVQIGIQMYFNSPDVFLNGVDLARKLTAEEVKVRMYLCQVRLNPTTYRRLMDEMTTKSQVVSYPTVRSEIRTFNMQGDQRRYECTNLFQGRIPNRVIVGMVLSTAFTGNVVNDPFCFQKFGMSSIKQLVGGEEYPYETLELVHNDATKDLRGYHRFLQATGCLCKQQGNMVRGDDWGQGKNCTLFVFDNVANGCVDSYRMNPKQAGNLLIELNFGANPAVNLTIIVYGEFENLLEIDKNKAVLYDVYQR
ncbi:hypothetical protein ACROYT_G004940 [Oculina patagonica]